MALHFKLLLIALLGCGVLAQLACRKPDEFNTTAGVTFTRDTVRFDTVFVARGSATRYFKIKNTANKRLKIDEISLKGGANSQFKLNIDGTPTAIARDVEVEPNDSLYVFVQVNIDPNNSDAPFIVSDEVVTKTNGNTQRVVLEAFGQNANYIGARAGLKRIKQDATFNSTKPYVVYGTFLVDSTATLTLAPGTRIYVHGGIVKKNGIYIDPADYPYYDGTLRIEGNLKAMGTKQQPIIITGDRLEHDREQTLEALNYSEVTGQWQGLLFIGEYSKQNELNYCVIKNAVFGVAVVSDSKVKIRNSILHNHSAFCLYSFDSEGIEAENSLFYSANIGVVSASYGGNCKFDHCTIACYGSPSQIEHAKPSLVLSNFWCKETDAVGSCIDRKYKQTSATFRNCIIYGSLNDEIVLDKQADGGAVATLDAKFDNCLIRKKDLKLSDGTFTNCTFNSDPNYPRFKNVDKLNYTLDSLSGARGLALRIAGIDRDLLDAPRKTPNTAVGCYEYGY